jgi:hypothetical protein
MNMPDDFVPHGNCEPLDDAALKAFWDAGPQPCGLVRQQWIGQAVRAPAVFWRCVDPTTNAFQLTGAGAALGPKIAMGMSLP